MAQWDTLGFMKVLIKASFIALCLTAFSCSNKIEKPLVTVQKFSLQNVQMNEVLNKLLNEKDVKIMYYMADGIESTRAVDCSPVVEECNLYYGFINKVVNLTRDKDFSEEDRKILNALFAEFQNEMIASEKKLKLQWKNYINSQSN